MAAILNFITGLETNRLLTLFIF